MPVGDNNANSWNALLAAEFYDGMGGIDTVSYANSNAAVFVDFMNNVATGGFAQGDTFSNMENIIGSAFADTLIGNNLANTLDGGNGNDTLRGMGGNDTLLGGDGNDTLNGGTGADILNGGTGIDTAVYSNSTLGVVVNLNIGTGQLWNGSEAAGDILSGIENLTGSGFADTLIGDSSNNVLNGGNGNDTLIGGAGADTLIGGAGIDTVSYATSTTNYSVQVDLELTTQNTVYNSGGGWASAYSEASGDVLISIENIIGTDAGYLSNGTEVNFGGDKLRGNDNINTIIGGAGNDLIEGRGGADTLIGGVGSHDIVSYESSTAGVTVDLGLSTAQISAGDASGDILSGFEDINGSSYNDTLTGTTGNNILNGGGGDDVLIGGAGADTLIGGAGNDTIIDSSGSSRLIGGQGDDVLISGSGFDIINDLVGSNTMTGGVYGDIFDFGAYFEYGVYGGVDSSATVTNTDTLITDFEVGVDQINVASGSVITLSGSSSETVVTITTAYTNEDGAAATHTATVTLQGVDINSLAPDSISNIW